MKFYLKYHPNSSVTGKILGERLNIPYGLNPLNQVFTRQMDIKVIEWGISGQNKYYQLSKLIEDGVTVPNITDNIVEAVALLPVIFRPYYHRGGNHFYYLETKEDLLEFVKHQFNGKIPTGYFSHYISSDREYRVHVFNRDVICVQRKEKEQEQGIFRDWTQDLLPCARNHINGWVFKQRDINRIHPDIKTQAIMAVRSLGLLFGAVDIIRDKESNKSYVLEVNSAPALEGTTLDLYVENFKSYMNGIGDSNE